MCKLIYNVFIHYQVRLGLPNADEELWEGNFLSPDDIWHRVDLPFWTSLQNQRKRDNSFSSLQVEKVTQYTTLYNLEEAIFISKEKRRELISSLGSSNNTLMANTEDLRLAQICSGRKLLFQEVFAAWKQNKEPIQEELALKQYHIQEENIINLVVTLQKLYLQGFFDWQSAIGRSSAPYCRRCGYAQESARRSFLSKILQLLHSKEGVIRVACQRCGQENCYYCPRCLQMGRAKACEPLFNWTYEMDSSAVVDMVDSNRKNRVVFHWQGELSLAQQEASTKLLNFIHTPLLNPCGQQALPVHQSQEKQAHRAHQQNKEFLIWAVCGAGKTEILFQTIFHSLLKQQKILITSPRRDVILELAPRLQEAFPQTVIRTLYADSKEKYAAGDLILATTHQTLRFERFFDLVIIDEEDAFPFHHDPMLPNAVQRAKKPSAPIVYLTATPRKEMIRRVHQRELEFVLISKRYHGHPLAVPVIQPIGPWRKQIKQKTLLTPLLQYVAHLAHQQRFGYLFVPHVRDLVVVSKYLQQTIVPYLQKQPSLSAQALTYLYSINIETVHAEHPDRTAIVQRFRKQQIHILLTTTILERGVTIPYSDVAVLGSDDVIFDTAALIQIAGRVGRKLEDPVGKVWFFPEARTNAQVRSIQQIKEWNKQ